MIGVMTGVLALGATIATDVAKQQAYKEVEFRMPVDLPMNLSGNFGQLRTTHFHGGLDIRTNQVIGHKVSAVGEGYVSRVAVNIYGYGKVVYVNHPNGKTTVYAHLDKFSDTLASLVEKEWAATKKYEVDISLPAGKVPVQGGSLLGLSGNTGGSGGPHLHFEVRDTKTGDLLNPLKHGYKITDTKSPVFTELKLYTLETRGRVNGKINETIVPITGGAGAYSVRSAAIPVSGKLGIGINAYDPLDLNSFRMGLYKVQLYVNGKIIYGYTLDKYSVEEGKRITVHCDYENTISSNNAMEKLWVLPGNDSRIYEYGPGSGVINIEPGKKYAIKIVAEDVNGNTSKLEFSVAGVNQEAEKNEKKQGKLFSFLFPENDSLTEKTFKLKLPPDALFDDAQIHGFIINGLLTGELAAWQIGNEKIILKKPAEITVDISSIPTSLFAKLYALHEGKRQVPLKLGQTSLTLSYGRLGRFAIYADTIVPSLSAMDITPDNRIGKNGSNLLRFKVSDKETGLAEWEAYLNDDFLMLEYEYKDKMLFAIKPTIKTGNNKIRVWVKDGVGNKTEYETVFIK